MQAAQRSAVQIPPRPGACMHANTMQAVKKARSSTHARGWILVPIPMQCNAMHCKHPRPVPVLVFRWTAELSLRWRWTVVSRRKRKRWPAGRPRDAAKKRSTWWVALCSVHEPGQNAQYYFAGGREESAWSSASSPVQPPYPY